MAELNINTNNLVSGFQKPYNAVIFDIDRFPNRQFIPLVGATLVISASAIVSLIAGQVQGIVWNGSTQIDLLTNSGQLQLSGFAGPVTEIEWLVQLISTAIVGGAVAKQMVEDNPASAIYWNARTKQNYT